jgi:hypothetical protein
VTLNRTKTIVSQSLRGKLWIENWKKIWQKKY